MAHQTIKGEDTSLSKTDDIIDLQEKEKADTESPIESIVPLAEHVTAKTWLVIFVSSISPSLRKTSHS